MNPQNANRLYYIDNLRGLLILFVILGHCVQYFIADYDHNFLFRFIYSFHMPLFMALSGYVSYSPYNKWKTVSRRFVQLIVPFFAWLIVSTISVGNISHFYGTLLKPDNGLWFLWVLFFIILIFKICDELSSKLNFKLEWIAIAVATLMLGCTIIFKIKIFSFHNVAWYFVFYCIGFFGRKQEVSGRIVTKGIAVVLLTLFCILVPFWMRKEPPTFLPNLEGGKVMLANYTYRFVTATLAVIAMITLGRLLLDRKIMIVSKLGGATLGMYAIHQPIVALAIVGMTMIDARIVGNAWFLIPLFLVSTVISYGIFYILDKCYLTSLLFLGRNKRVNNSRNIESFEGKYIKLMQLKSQDK